MTRYQQHNQPRIHAALSITLVFALCLQSLAQAIDTAPKPILLKRGRVVELSLVSPIDSSHAKVGEDVALRVVRPLMAEGSVAVPADSLVHGQVTSVTRAGKNCKSGLVRWNLDHLPIAGGKQSEGPVHSRIPRQTRWNAGGSSRTRYGGKKVQQSGRNDGESRRDCTSRSPDAPVARFHGNCSVRRRQLRRRHRQGGNCAGWNPLLRRNFDEREAGCSLTSVAVTLGRVSQPSPKGPLGATRLPAWKIIVLHRRCCRFFFSVRPHSRNRATG